MANEMTLANQIELANRMAASNLLPQSMRGRPENLLYALQYAQALDVHPMTAITGIHVIEGKPTASADLIAAMVRRAGHRLRVETTDVQATATIFRKDDPDFAYKATWTMDRARTAGLTGKGPWKAYPAAMLKARAITEVARLACSECLFGVIYTAEELGANVTADGEVIDVARDPEPAPVVVRDWQAELDACEERQPLRDLLKAAQAAKAGPEVVQAIIAKGKALAEAEKVPPAPVAEEPHPFFDGEEVK